MVVDENIDEAVRKAKQDLRDLTQHYREEREEQTQARRAGVFVLWTAIVGPIVLFLFFMFR
jgi:hypothetical protein